MAPNGSASNVCHRIDDCHPFLRRGVPGELRTLDRTTVTAADQIRNATLQCSDDVNQSSRAYSVCAVLVLLHLLERDTKRSAELFLAHLDLIASGSNTFTHCDTGL